MLVNKPSSAALLAMLLAACAGPLAGCGGATKHESAVETGARAVTLAGGEQASEAAAESSRRARMKKSEELEEAELKEQREVAERRARAAAAEAAARTHTGKKRSAGHDKRSQKSPSPRSATKAHKLKGPKSKESPAEEAARKQFAKEEAQETAAFRRQEREEAAGR